MQYDVFISYSRKDYVDESGRIIKGNIVSKIKDALRNNGISYWIDEDGISSGDAFAQLITNSIKNSRTVVFISSENSNKSEWTRKEIAAAVYYNKKIIPFRYDETPFNEAIYLYLADLDYISYKTNGDIAISKLVNSVKRCELPQVVEMPQNPKLPEPKVIKPVKKWYNLLFLAVFIAVLTYAVVMTTNEPSDDNVVDEQPLVTEQAKDVSILVNGVSFDLVKLKEGVYIGKCEVTQRQWNAIMGTTVSQLRDRLDHSLLLRGVGDDYPIYYVSWNDCNDFIAKLNEMTGKNFRLPTETEWEDAAGGECDDIDNLAWYDDNSDESTHSVGKKAPNSMGIYDIMGNVSEWCSDGKVVKGGCWASLVDNCRTSNRMNVDASMCSDAIGFRLVLE